MSNIKKMCITAMCAALCYILPLTVHPFGEGLATAVSPMHFPVLLCGLTCGWAYGGVCGLIGPVLSFLVTGRPAVPRLIWMVTELIAYGVLSGLFMKLIRTGRTYLDLYLSMLPAMLLGRVVGGVVQWATLLSGGKSYSLALWAGSYLAATAFGAILQLLLIPGLYLTLVDTKLIPNRYGRVGVR